MRVVPIKLAFSNAYLVIDQRTIVVDTGSPNEADKIVAAMKRAGVNSKDVALILHTHSHPDHAGSTRQLRSLIDAPTAIQAADAQMLTSGVPDPVKPISLEAQLVKAMLVKPFPGIQPDVIIERNRSLADYGVNGRVLLTPGHTPGSISVLLNNGEAIIGDVLMGGWIGGNVFGTRPNYHYFIDDRSALHASLKNILAQSPTRLYVGHGGPLDPAVVQRRFASVLAG
jgi:glyoxylase-like metal-dependent hydrolase (beta-lactamase superfamily II)